MASQAVADNTIVRKIKLKDFLSGSTHSHTESDITDLDHISPIVAAMVCNDDQIICLNNEIVTI